MSILLEQEVKFRLPFLDDVAARLVAMGAELVRPRHFESNQLFDFGDARIGKRGSALRLRRVGNESWLTFKGPHHGSGKIKQRRELETTLGDAEAMEEILESLSLEERFRYEKYRTCYRVGDVGLFLDETPIGAFVEIEANPDGIAAMAERLSLDISQALVSTYPRLYELHRQEFPDAPAFMTFPEPPSASRPPA